MNIDTTALDALFDSNPSAARAFAAAYQVLIGGVPSQEGFTTLINNAVASNFGARISTSDPGPAFNQENIFINIANALIQGNSTAAATFSNISAGGTLAQKVTSLYNVLVPASDQTQEGLDFLVRPDGLLFYQNVAIERGVAGVDGAAIVALASLLNVAVSANIGVGNHVNDLIMAVDAGSSQLPVTSSIFIDIDVADGSGFDADDPGGPTTPTVFSPGIDNIVGVEGLFNEVFAAVAGQVTAADSLDGGDGIDTFITTGSTVLPQLKNVEVVEFVDIFQGKDVDTISIPPDAGVTEVKIRDSMFIGDRSILLQDQKFTLSNATFGDRGVQAPTIVDGGTQKLLGPRVDIDLSVTQSSSTIFLDNVGAGRTPTFDLTGSATDITTLTLVGSGAKSEISLADDDNKLTTVIVTGDQTVNVYNSNITSLQTVDMSAAFADQMFSNLATADITVVGGFGRNTIAGGNGIDSIDITRSGASVDTIDLSSIKLNTDRDVISGFKAGPGGDVIRLSETLNLTTMAGDAPTFQQANAAGTHTFQDNTDVIEFAFDITGTSLGAGDAAALNGAALLAAVGSVQTVSAGNGYAIAYQSGNAYLYFGGNFNDLSVDAGEIQLIATINNVAVGSLEASNFLLT